MSTPASAAGEFPPEPSSVAIAGDWHGNIRWARIVVARLAERRVDAIVHTGDFGLWPGTQGQAYLDDLEAVLAAHDLPLYWVDGNHDDHHSLATWPLSAQGVRFIRPHIVHLPRGFRWSWQGQTWLACGGAVSVDRALRSPGLSWWPEEVITDDDVAAAAAGGDIDVLVCHDAPSGVEELDDWLLRNGMRLAPEVLSDADHNRGQVRRIIEATRPRFVFHGHYHHKYRGSVTSGTRTAAVVGLDCDGTAVNRNVLRLQLPLQQHPSDS